MATRTRRAHARLVALALAGLVATPAITATTAAAPSGPVPMFGDCGRVAGEPGGPPQRLDRVAPATDGGVIAVAATEDASGRPAVAVVRWLADGTPDPAFGTAGRALVALPEGADPDTPWAALEGTARLAFHPDGGMYVGVLAAYDRDRIVLVRLAADGTPVAGFGEGGTTVVDAGSDGSETLGDLVVHDDRLIVAGSTDTDGSGVESVLLVGLGASDGEPDPTFGTAGKTVTDLSATDRAAAVALDGEGRVVVAGSTVIDGSTDLLVLRYAGSGATAGQRDMAFGTGGHVALDLSDDGPSPEDEVRDVAVLEAGGIAVAGLSRTTGPGGSVRVGLARFEPDGALDDDFGEGGWSVVEPVPATGEFAVEQVGLAPGGGVAVAGTIRYVDGEGFVLADTEVGVTRLDADGITDAGFGDGSVTAIPLAGAAVFDTSATAVAIDPSDRMLVAASTGSRYELARILPDGRFDAHGWCHLRDGHAENATLVTRLAGENRYETAAAVSRQAFRPGVDVVYVATGELFPDALAGAPAAAVRGGPILLVHAGGIPAATRDELERLQPATIVALGGEAVIPGAVYDALAAYARDGIRRLAGTDRYETAAAISSDTFAPGVESAFVATGQNFPDALAAAAAAGARAVPILLVTRDAVPAATMAELERLRPEFVYLVGGPAVVSDAVAQALSSRFPDGRRLHGADRYETAVAVATLFPATEGRAVFVATGANFPDALAGGVVGALAKGPLLLVPSDRLLNRVRGEIARFNPSNAVVLGGEVVVSRAVALELARHGAIRYRFLQINPDDSQVRHDPCTPIPWVYNPDNAPFGAQSEADVKEGFERLAATTGMTFAYEGYTEETSSMLSTQSRAYQPDVYGDRWAPVLVWWDASLPSFIAGLAGPDAVVPIGPTPPGYTRPPAAFASGTVALNPGIGLPAGYGDGVTIGDVILHEYGHLVGLDHVGDRTQIMYASVDHGVDAAGGPAGYRAGDREGLHALGRSAGCLDVPHPSTFAGAALQYRPPPRPHPPAEEGAIAR